MALSAFDVQKNSADTTDAGIDLVVDSIASPAGSVGVTKVMFGLAGENDGIVDSTTPLPVETVDVAGTLNADITTIAGAVAGSEMQVDVITMPSVDVTSVVPGTAATNLGKAEDAAHTTGDVRVMPLAVRNDDLAALAGTDGDYAPLQVTQNGALLTCQSANDDYKYGVIDAAVLGDNTLQAAIVGRKIRVLSLFMVAAGTVATRIEDGASGTALTGQMNLVANTGFVLPHNPAGWFETSVNTLLNFV